MKLYERRRPMRKKLRERGISWSGRATRKNWRAGSLSMRLGSRRDILVVVMDNVDRLELREQLNAFQLTLSFMAETEESSGSPDAR